MRSWDELKPDLDRVVFRDGVQSVANAIPADRVTVYRLLRGDTIRPSRAVRAGIERVVDESRDHDSDYQHSNDPEQG